MRWLLVLAFVVRGTLWAGIAADLGRALRENSFDRDECYRVRDITIFKEDLKIYLTDGHLIFSKPVASAPASRAPRRRPGRPRGSKNASPPVASATRAAKTTPAAKATTAKRAARTRGARRKGSGKRGAQALALIQGQPGVAIPELATKMGIQQNYLYRVLPRLEQEGSQDGR